MSSHDRVAESSTFWIETEDWHTAGEPFRIIEKLPAGHLPDANSVAERRTVVLNTPSHPLDTLRRTLCHEPRGHADMYGGFVTPANDSGAHFGVLFWHKDGFSVACGHGTIALGFWAVRKRLVDVPQDNGVVDVVIDVPSGRVTARVTVNNGRPIHADFMNVPCYGVTSGTTITVNSLGLELPMAISYGGAHFGSVNASKFGLSIEPRNITTFIALGQEIKAALMNKEAPYPCGAYEIYAIIFFEDEARQLEDSKDTVRQRSVTIYADGQVDRSPCGSGTCGRLAVLQLEGRIGPGRGKLFHRSIIGTEFVGDLVSQGERQMDGFMRFIPRVRGTANLVGKMSFYVDSEDPIYPGFVLR